MLRCKASSWAPPPAQARTAAKAARTHFLGGWRGNCTEPSPDKACAAKPPSKLPGRWRELGMAGGVALPRGHLGTPRINFVAPHYLHRTTFRQKTCHGNFRRFVFVGPFHRSDSQTWSQSPPKIFPKASKGFQGPAKGMNALGGPSKSVRNTFQNHRTGFQAPSKFLGFPCNHPPLLGSHQSTRLWASSRHASRSAANGCRCGHDILRETPQDCAPGRQRRTMTTEGSTRVVARPRHPCTKAPHVMGCCRRLCAWAPTVAAKGGHTFSRSLVLRSNGGRRCHKHVSDGCGLMLLTPPCEM